MVKVTISPETNLTGFYKYSFPAGSFFTFNNSEIWVVLNWEGDKAKVAPLSELHKGEQFTEDQEPVYTKLDVREINVILN